MLFNASSAYERWVFRFDFVNAECPDDCAALEDANDWIGVNRQPTIDSRIFVRLWLDSN